MPHKRKQSSDCTIPVNGAGKPTNKTLPLSPRRAQTVVEKSYLSFSRSSLSSWIIFYSRPLFTGRLCVFPSSIVRKELSEFWGKCFQTLALA